MGCTVDCSNEIENRLTDPMQVIVGPQFIWLMIL